jgi:hypothetical protein
MPKPTLTQAAAILGRKGGKAGGVTKSRTGISERMKAWWASPAAAARRKKLKGKTHDQTEKSKSPRGHSDFY